MWWKPVGVVGLWLALIAAPHLGMHPAVQMVVPPTAVATTTQAEEQPSAKNTKAPAEAADPGDPPIAGTNAPATAHEAANAVVTIRFKNSLDKNLVLLQASLAMDGEPLAPVTEINPGSENVVFTGHVTPGAHQVSTHLTCQGKKRGVFTYTQNYRFHVHSEQTVNALENRAIVFTIAAVRHKGINVPLDELVDVTVFNELLPQPVSERR